MDAKKLASLLRGGPGGPLVIDSRSFVEYNSWHVLSSVNICCSKLVKRRLQQGKVTIAELIQPAARSQVPYALSPRVSPSPLSAQLSLLCPDPRRAPPPLRLSCATSQPVCVPTQITKVVACPVAIPPGMSLQEGIVHFSSEPPNPATGEGRGPGAAAPLRPPQAWAAWRPREGPGHSSSPL